MRCIFRRRLPKIEAGNELSQKEGVENMKRRKVAEPEPEPYPYKVGQRVVFANEYTSLEESVIVEISNSGRYIKLRGPGHASWIRKDDICDTLKPE